MIRHVVLGEYDTHYAEAFRRAASEPPDRKLAALLAPGVKLPGLGAPTGSTVIHFIDPSMPIIDVRTVETLFEAGLISSKQRDLRRYEEYRLAIEGIRQRCPGWSVRQIDRALFAYHKQVLDKKVRKRNCSGQSHKVAPVALEQTARASLWQENKMNAYVQRIKSLLASERGLIADVAETGGTDQRLYAQVIGVQGFPVFTIKPRTGAYELPFEHTYTKKNMKEKMGLPILDCESEGLNAVLFADKLAARPQNRHDLYPGYDPNAIERVRQMAAEVAPDKSQMIWREPTLEQTA